MFLNNSKCEKIKIYDTFFLYMTLCELIFSLSLASAVYTRNNNAIRRGLRPAKTSALRPRAIVQ